VSIQFRWPFYRSRKTLESSLSLEKVKEAPEKLLWVDLETGGLDEFQQPIFEVAAIVTKGCFDVIGSFHRLIYQSPETLAKMEPGARELLTANGLLQRLSGGTAKEQVELEFSEFIEGHFQSEKAILAGNSVHRDRSFFRIWMPKVYPKLSHRVLDVSSFKVFFQMTHQTQAVKNAPHLAMEDIRLSIEELKAYSAWIENPR